MAMTLSESLGDPHPNPLPVGEGVVKERLSFKELLPLKGVEAGEAAAQDKGVDFIRALIGVD